MKEIKLFDSINEENVRRLVYMFMLRKEEPWVIAVVANRLEPELGRKMLMCLPTELQAKVALMGLTIQTVTKDQLVAIDKSIRENIDFLLERMERLNTELERTDLTTRHNVINYLKIEKPHVYDELRKHYLVFEDLMTVPSRDMQEIVRNLKTELMSKALQNAPPGLLNLFCSHMSAGAASLLRESMQYCSNISEIEIDEARFKAVEIIHGLEKNRVITARSEYVRRILEPPGSA